MKIKKYFGVKGFQKLSEEFLETFQARQQSDSSEDMLSLKNQLTEEKDKRILSLANEFLHGRYFISGQNLVQ